MIGFLEGVVLVKDSPHILIKTSGVGYKILVSSEIFSKVKVGEKLELFIYTHVKEDALELFGFLDQSSLKLFEKLISISGIGPKTAMGVFSLGTTSEIISAILTNNVSFFSGVPRLGTKNAQKIIIELKGKLGGVGELDLGGDAEFKEVLDALKQFGFSSKESSDAIRSIKSDGSSEEKIKLALKYLGK